MAAAVLAAALAVTPIANDAPALFTPGRDAGAQPSAYVGRFYNPDDEGFRRCVAQREGRHQYWVTGANGRYVGTYQFTRALARGAVWMMAKEWADLYGPAKARDMRKKLHAVDPTRWSREVWDQAFWTVLNWSGPRSGARHWAGGRFTCTPGMAWAGEQ